MINAPYKQGVFADSNLMPGGMPIICVQSSHTGLVAFKIAHKILERKNVPFEISLKSYLTILAF